jgi:deoxycytidylate deaminase
MNFDWSDLAFGSKKPVKELHAIFITAPREISAARFTQIIKDYLPKGNLVLGISKEDYVLGLESQPQFKMLRPGAVQSIIDKVNTSPSKHKIYTLKYSQRDITHVLEKLNFKNVLLVNGSWYTAFHFRPEYHTLVQNNIPFEKISPFKDEQEAHDYEDSLDIPEKTPSGHYSDIDMLNIANQVAKRSFDYGGFQTGVALGRKKGDKYKLVATAFNAVVPYQTYAMHFGSLREKHLSPPQDLNYYDTIHAEVALINKAQKEKLDIKGTTLFINLMPCPTCARMLSQTDITGIVYSVDHSEGYALKLLASSGKKAIRLVP